MLALAVKRFRAIAWMLCVLGASFQAPWVLCSTLRDLDLTAPPHSYYDRPAQDRFSKLRPLLDSGEVALDRSGEKAFLLSVLTALEVPASSQMLVFSTTSLQLSLITPANPRALYFNDDTYVGFIPGGKIEVVSIDPDLGGIFHIMDIPRSSSARGPLVIERSQRCMNCHSGSETGYVPGLVIKSVVPGPRGGSVDAFRVDQTGHGIPLSERFGGWYLTRHPFGTNTWANAIGHSAAGEITLERVEPGERFDWAKFPVRASGLPAHLLHEHQAGFINRVLQGTYTARAFLPHGGGANGEAELTPAQSGELEARAAEIVRYTLFAGEAALPAERIEVEPDFAAAFMRAGPVARNGASLRELDLKTRLLQHRCSYMIHSAVWKGMPRLLKERVNARLLEALSSGAGEFTYLPEGERFAILEILRATMPELAAAERKG